VSENRFSHDRLEVYQLAIEFVGWSHTIVDSRLAGDALRSQLERASMSIPLNIAEGNGRSSKKNRARFWQTALDSALECAAILDVLVARKIRTVDEVAEGQGQLERIARMLIGLLKRLGTKAPLE
jgi:four helix bundle protein